MQPTENLKRFSNLPLLLLKCTGLSYISFDAKRNSFKCSMTYNFWSSVCFVAAFFVMFSNLNYYYNSELQIPHETRFTLVLIYAMYLYTPNVVLVINICIMKFKQNSIAEIFNTVRQFRGDFKSSFLDQQLRIFYCATSVMLLETVAFNVLFLFPCFIYPSIQENSLNVHHLLYAFFMNYIHIGCILIEVFHFLFLILLAGFFSRIDDYFRKASMKKDVCRMRDCLKLYQRMYLATRQVNDTFSLPLLFLIGSYFIYLYLHLFGIYAEIKYDRKTPTGFAGIYAVVTIGFKMWFYAFVANKTMKEANKIKRTAIDIVISTRDQSIRKETNALALQLCHEQVQIVAGGFFTIDFPLLFEMMAACSTYIVITIQFIDINL